MTFADLGPLGGIGDGVLASHERADLGQRADQLLVQIVEVALEPVDRKVEPFGLFDVARKSRRHEVVGVVQAARGRQR